MFLKKIKIEISYVPTICLLKRNEKLIRKDMCNSIYK